MRVAFEASTIAFEKRTGTGVYARELVTAYEALYGKKDQITHTYRFSRIIKGRKYLLPLRKGVKREVLLDNLTAFRGKNYDIFHGLNSRLPVLNKTKTVATIHDLFSIFGEYSKPEFKKDQTEKLTDMISRADHIIVPSTVLKTQLVDHLKVSPKKVTVVTEGVREMFLTDVTKDQSKEYLREKYKLSSPFIFYVGTLEKRKNIVRMIEAFKRVHKNKNGKLDLDLVLAGSPGFEYDAIELAIKESGLENRIKKVGFIDQDLFHFYKGSEAFIFITLEEGFGIPIIEAMACGTPILSSNTTSLPEVGAGFTWLVNPTDIEEITYNLEQVLNLNISGLERVKKGRIHAQKLTWTHVARLTRKVYQRIVKG
jgi:glycosyltransferase involved in cell wall biosynthesis